MKQLIATILAATFAVASLNALAQDKSKTDAKKPSAEDCKKNPKMKGCDQMKK
ncbi:MAG TPA: hypothetical protein VLV56_07655 [Burkholderiales bacterium]|nr:hypothetical protein [Burkholderiales bacterium]